MELQPNTAVDLDLLGEAKKKRELEIGKDEKDAETVKPAVKKGKQDYPKGEAYMSEVEETSRDWSQSYK